MIEKQTNPEEGEVKKLEKIDEYLKARKEIFDFVTNHYVRKIILSYLGLVSVILMIGGNAYFNYVVKDKVEERISEKINEEFTYLSERNKIAELGDLAITNNKVKYYEEIKIYLSSKKPERICTAAKAEILRIQSYLSTWGYSDLSIETTIHPKTSIFRWMRAD